MSEITDLLLQGPRPARELIQRLGISQATFSRRVLTEKDIIKFGQARATQYGLKHPVRQKDAFQLWQIDDQGKAWSFGVLYPMWPRGSCLVIHDNGESSWFDGLPWYLRDLRPQGFLGRAWGRELARKSDLPEDIRLWQEEDVLFALSVQEPEHLGGWLVGEESYRRWATAQAALPVPCGERLRTYSELAHRAMDGEIVGSSAGGEQPKFSSYSETSRGARQVIVKFTPAVHNANQRRWADLLTAEAAALALLNDSGISAAQCELLRAETGQVFLEVERFDCVGAHGRLGIVSLESVQSEFASGVLNWPKAVARLKEAGIVDAATLRQVQKVWAFGRLIANSDMHAGNLSFFLSDRPLALAPVYDMLPMAYAPGSTGSMLSQVYDISLDAAIPGAVWLEMQSLARRFWLALSQNEQVSEPFRLIAAEMAERVESLRESLRRLA
ncbi:putative DNA-binding transcriptional regulator [Cedecea davisae]|uniref:HipA-like protein n=1 Tax=Cedecea davisae DSM 4568 TaxID=566551 RepID=S3JKM3_9ENTR|nr:type II toxin-antitoxin system HipA family toxin YjjJ [Cedecea davisae]EPF20707.1 HipA-like protein [Cedecea davisae DSM 4568]SUX36505.1 putative DNA-binding transcriptional regulator [Cedecea davisae]